MRVLYIIFFYVILMQQSLPAQVVAKARCTTAPKQITLNFGGDVTLADYFQWYVGKRYSYPFAKLKAFGRADISMVNLENPLTKRGRVRDKPYVFRALPEYVRILQNGGIDLVNLANNHIYDYSRQGLLDTIQKLDAAGIFHVGAGRNLAAARQPVILTVKGVRLGFLAYYGLRAHSESHPATADSAGTALRNLRFIRQDIQNLKAKTDLIIVNFHWGREKQIEPDAEQIYFAHKTIDYGADLIVGHHPHVWQGLEKYKGKIIAYSLGNFIFGGNSRKHETSAFLRVYVSVKSKQVNGVEIIPVQINYWQPQLLSGAEAQNFIHRLKQISSHFKKSIF